jgi:hypothetical protein
MDALFNAWALFVDETAYILYFPMDLPSLWLGKCHPNAIGALALNSLGTTTENIQLEHNEAAWSEEQGSQKPKITICQYIPIDPLPAPVKEPCGVCIHNLSLGVRIHDGGENAEVLHIVCEGPCGIGIHNLSRGAQMHDEGVNTGIPHIVQAS